MIKNNQKFQTDDECSVEESNVVTRLQHFEHQQETDHELSFVQKIFRKYYGPVLLQPITKALAVGLFIVYLILAIWGTLLMPSGLQPEKLVSKNHYVYHYLYSYNYWKDGLPLQILLNNPPNISLYEERRKVFAMVAQLENTKHTMDERFTMFWMKEYQRHLNESGFQDSPNAIAYSASHIKSWIGASSGGSYWESCIRWGNESAGEDPNAILAFRFTVSTAFRTTVN